MERRTSSRISAQNAKLKIQADVRVSDEEEDDVEKVRTRKVNLKTKRNTDEEWMVNGRGTDEVEEDDEYCDGESEIDSEDDFEGSSRSAGINKKDDTKNLWGIDNINLSESGSDSECETTVKVEIKKENSTEQLESLHTVKNGSVTDNLTDCVKEEKGKLSDSDSDFESSAKVFKPPVNTSIGSNDLKVNPVKKEEEDSATVGGKVKPEVHRFIRRRESKRVTTSKNAVINGAVTGSLHSDDDFESLPSTEPVCTPKVQDLESDKKIPVPVSSKLSSTKEKSSSMNESSKSSSSGEKRKLPSSSRERRSKAKKIALDVSPSPNVHDVGQLDVAQLLALGEKFDSNEEEKKQKKEIPKSKNSSAKKTKHRSDSESEAEWEEVEGELGENKIKHEIPKDGVEITVEAPNLNFKKKKKGFDMQAYIKRKLNGFKRSIQVEMHKVHVLGWMAHGIYVNSVLNSDNLTGVALSLIPSQHCYPPNRLDMSYLEKFLNWFRDKITLDKANNNDSQNLAIPLLESLENQFDERKAVSKKYLVLMFIITLRSLGVAVRLILSFQPVPLKLTLEDAIPRSRTKSSEEGESSPSTSTSKGDEGQKTKIKNAVKSEKSASKDFIVGKLRKGSKEEVRRQSESLQRDEKCKDSTNVESKIKATKEKTVKKREKSNTLNGAVSVKQEKQLNTTSKAGGRASVKADKKPEQAKSATGMDSRNSINLERLRRKVVTNQNRSPEIRNKEEKGRDTQNKSRKSSQYFQTEKSKVGVRTSSRRKSAQTSYVENSENDTEVEEVKAQKLVKREKKKSDGMSASRKKENVDSDFEPEVLSMRKPLNRTKVSPKDRRLLSSSDEDNAEKPSSSKKKRNPGMDMWVEVYLEQEERWMSVDVICKKIYCDSDLEASATHPLTYVVSFDNSGRIKDVTRRYASKWLTGTQKIRAAEDWWLATLRPFLGKQTARDKEEDEDLAEKLSEKPIPASISELKSHPLYALKRHLLKFEAIYPPDAPPLGFIRNEPVYARECVKTLHSRETWLKQAKTVRLKEKPYKIVKARPKYDRMSHQMITDQPLEIFGEWQVEEYVPPPAVDGKVPRNEYGNVELFKPSMLPKGTVHLQVSGLNRVARKLGIDCAPAMVGWDYHCGGSHPMFDGFVVCEEFEDIIMDAWNQEQEEQERREREKIEKRVYDNWRRLIRGLLIRERLKLKYSIDDDNDSKKSKSSKGKVLEIGESSGVPSKKRKKTSAEGKGK